MLGGVVTGSVIAAVVGARDAAKSLMQDTCTITRPGASTTIDPATGQPVQADPTTIYTGSCKLQSADLEVADPKSGGHVYAVQRMTLHLPVSATGLAVGDVATITASSSDPAQVGRIFRVAGLFRKTFASAQRLPVEEVVA